MRVGCIAQFSYVGPLDLGSGPIRILFDYIKTAFGLLRSSVRLRHGPSRHRKSRSNDGRNSSLQDTKHLSPKMSHKSLQTVPGNLMRQKGRFTGSGNQDLVNIGNNLFPPKTCFRENADSAQRGTEFRSFSTTAFHVSGAGFDPTPGPIREE